ncbi:MAG: hypothetical protein J5842_00160 [Lachnospiraceae bacterium]|nr:hypothetical protein [Lachnospiraceae bacterium]
MVALIFIMCISGLALILLVAFLVPPLFSLQAARDAFKDQQYYEAYEGLIGRELSEEDERIFMKSRIILRLQHKIDAYQHYIGLDMPVEALDSLMAGYALYGEMEEDITNYDAAVEAGFVKDQILTLLVNGYGLDEASVQQIYALDDFNYTLKLEGITGALSRQNSNFNKAETQPGVLKPPAQVPEMTIPSGEKDPNALGEDGEELPGEDIPDYLPEEGIQ